jgi:hypothetical protein
MRERERERENKLPQIFLVQEVDPFFDKDNQHSPNMTSGDVCVHLNGKNKLFLISNKKCIKKHKV